MDDLPVLYVEPQPWMAAARCRDSDPDLFFPTRGGPDVTAHAKAVCAQCPVRSECLEYAVVHEERYGVWGGLSPNERRPLVRERRRLMPLKAIAHGTNRGYRMHHHRGEVPCVACKWAHADEMKDYKARRKEMAS